MGTFKKLVFSDMNINKIIYRDSIMSDKYFIIVKHFNKKYLNKNFFDILKTAE